MNEVLEKTQEEIEVTLLNGLYEYLKEHKFFERKGMFVYEKEQDLIDKIGYNYSPEKIYGYEDIAIFLLGNDFDKYKKHINNCGGLVFKSYDEFQEYAKDEINVEMIKEYIEDEGICINDLYRDDDILEFVADTYPDETLDYLSEDTIMDYVRDNYDISDWVEWR